MMRLNNIEVLKSEESLFEVGSVLQVEIEGVENRLKSVLVGIEPEEYLIIKLPTSQLLGSINRKLFRGNQISIRSLYAGTAFGFKTKIIEAIFSPIKLLFVEYPQNIYHHDLRSQKRVVCFLPARIKINNNERNGAIVDLSEEGCCYIFKMVEKEMLPALRRNERVIFWSQFPGIQGERVISGKIRNIIKKYQGMSLGVLFEKVDPEVQNIISRYIVYVKEYS